VFQKIGWNTFGLICVKIMQIVTFLTLMLSSNIVSNNLHSFAEVDDALLPTKNPMKKKFSSLFWMQLMMNKLTKRAKKSYSNYRLFGKWIFILIQVRTFVSVNSDINTPEVSMALNNISNFVKTSYSNYKQTTIIDYFLNKS